MNHDTPCDRAQPRLSSQEGLQMPKPMAMLFTSTFHTLLWPAVFISFDSLGCQQAV
jgi:hypothetical protein